MEEKTLYKLTEAQKLLKWAEAFSVERQKVKENNLISFAVKTPEYTDKNAEEIGDALENAFNEVVKNNDSLRLRIIKTKQGMRQYVKDFVPENFERTVLSGEEEFDGIVSTMDKNPDKFMVDWLDENLILTKIYVIDEHRCAMIIRFHHAVFDGYSIRLFFDQFGKAYELFLAGETPVPGSVKTGSIVSYFKENEDYLNSKQHKDDQKFWWKKFNSQHRYRMPAGRRAQIGDCDTKELNLEGETYHRLVELAKECDCSMQSFLMTLAAAATYVITGKDNFCFYSLTHGRRKYTLKKTIGCMMNTVPVIFDYKDKDKPIKQIASDDYVEYIEMLRHGQIPAGELTPITYVQGVLNGFNFNHGWMLFSTMDYEETLSGSDLEIDDLPTLNQAFQFYLSVLDTHQSSIKLILSYQTRKYKPEQIDRIVKIFDAMCSAVADNGEITINGLCTVLKEKKVI